ncbi:MAG: MoaD/ThiS family protein [Candidatus Hermodarchaeota archaeon]
MIDVKIVFYSILTDITDVDELFLSINDNSNIKNLLEQLSLKFGEKFEETIYINSTSLSKYILITINGKDIRTLEGLNTSIRKNDEIFFIPAIAGG